MCLANLKDHKRIKGVNQVSAKNNKDWEQKWDKYVTYCILKSLFVNISYINSYIQNNLKSMSGMRL
jgi:hypothetical protein